MKSRLFVAALFSVVVFSCAPKVVVQPSEPAVIQPPKPVEVVSAETPVSPEKLAEGKRLYDNNCAKCHKLFSPADYTREDWQPILVRMQRKARLDDIQMATVKAYVDSEAKS